MKVSKEYLGYYNHCLKVSFDRKMNIYFLTLSHAYNLQEGYWYKCGCSSVCSLKHS